MPRSSSTPCAPPCRGPATTCACCCTPSSRSSATPRGASCASQTHARPAARVGHAARAGAASRARGGRGARRRGARGAAGAAARRRRLRSDARAGRAHGGGRARSRRRARGRGGGGDHGVPEVAPQGALHPARRPRVHDRGWAVGTGRAGAAGLGARHPARRRRIALLPGDARRRAAGVPARAPRRRRRSARDRQDEPPLARAPARAHGRRVRACAPAGRLDCGAAARDRPVHLARLPGAGLTNAAPAPQAPGDHRGGGPDRGLARLQGDGGRLRVVPAGRALPGAHRSAAVRDRGGRARRGSTARDAHRAARRRQPQRHRDGGHAGRPHVDGAPHPAAGAARGAIPRRSAEYHLALVEGAAAQLFFLLHVPAGEAPEVPLDELEREVARRAAPGTTAWPTSSC